MQTHDLVVVIPGIMGSELTQNGSPIWTTSPGSLISSILQFSKIAQRLKLPDDIGDNAPDDGIIAGRLLNSLHVIPGIWSPICGYDQLLNRLRAAGFNERGSAPNLVPFSYDWRLSNRYNAGLLRQTVESALSRWRESSPERSSARAILVCHSMGGLIARWYVSLLGGHDIVSKIITLGTPHRGSLKAVTTLADGPSAPIARFAEILQGVASSLPSLHQLLPSYACVNTDGPLGYLVEHPVPGLSSNSIEDSAAFYSSLEEGERAIADPPTLYPVIGINQPTPTSLSLSFGRITVNEHLGDHTFGGDGTVPAASVPRGMSWDSPSLKRIGDKHGHLQANTAVLDEVLGVINASAVTFKSSSSGFISVDIAEVIHENDPISAILRTERIPTAVISAVSDEHGRLLSRLRHNIRNTQTALELGRFAPGGYTVAISPVGQTRAGVTTPFLVWPRDDRK